ncbi:MAG: PEP-CTERM sorting domain-containing protein [Hormoscilla sp.]
MKKITKTLAAAATTAATTALVATLTTASASATSFYSTEIFGGTLTIEFDGNRDEFLDSGVTDWSSVSFTGGNDFGETYQPFFAGEYYFEDRWDGAVRGWRPSDGGKGGLYQWVGSAPEHLLVKATDGTGTVTTSVFLEDEYWVETSTGGRGGSGGGGEPSPREGGSVVSGAGGEQEAVSTPEPSSAIALSVLALGAVASRLRRRSK